MQNHFRPGWSEVEQKVLPVLREPSGLGEIHILIQLADTLMQTNKGCVATINACDGESQTVDGVLWAQPLSRGANCTAALLSGFFSLSPGEHLRVWIKNKSQLNLSRMLMTLTTNQSLPLLQLQVVTIMLHTTQPVSVSSHLLHDVHNFI